MSEMKLVPVEPTREMVIAGEEAWDSQLDKRLSDKIEGVPFEYYPSEETHELCSRVAYRAMIAAAPTQPSPAESDKEDDLTIAYMYGYHKGKDSLDKEAVRNSVLEEAAKKLEAMKPGTTIDIVVQAFASEVRALKTASVSEVSHPSQTSNPTNILKTPDVDPSYNQPHLTPEYLGIQPAQPITQPGVLMVQEADTISYVHPEYGPGIFFTEDCVIDQPAQPSDCQWGAMRSAILKEFPLLEEEGLDQDKYPAEWVLQQERLRLHSVMGAAPLHMLIASAPKNRATAQPSDKEVIEWLLNQMSWYDLYIAGAREFTVEAVKSAMQAEREGS